MRMHPPTLLDKGSGVAMPPDAMLSKKEKERELIDARNKSI